MKISIIIPTYNEEDVIVNCLDSLKKQTEKDFEVIIVDDGSADHTLVKIKEYKGINLKVLSQAHKGAGAGRNLGAKQAKGSILVFVDADMTFEKHFVKNLVAPIFNGMSKGTFSKDEYVANWDNVWARCWNLNEGWEKKKRHPKNYPNTQKVFRAILKKEFDRVGGFTPGGYNDDWSLYEKLGYEATASNNAFFYHKNPSSLKEIFNHAKWVGKRKYKYGLFGFLIGLVRSSVPLSLVLGLTKSFIYAVPQFLIFKVVYDLGVFLGILDYMFTHKGSK